MLTATNRPAKASSILNGGGQERYFTKSQPAAAPQSFDTEAAKVQESIEETGQLVPVRDVTQLDSTDTARPMAMENRIERRVEPTKDAESEHRSRSQPEVGLRVAPRMSRSTRGMITPAPAYHGAKTRIGARPGGNSHTPVSLSVPAATSTRSMTTLAARSRGAPTHAAQSYIDSANREMDKGNYMAAIANYKRALQVDGNSSAAKARLGRARRAMHAENDIIANRR